MATDPRNLYLEGYDVNRALRKRIVSERALMCNDYDIPLTKLIGGMNAAPSKFGIPVITDTKYEWMYDGPLPVQCALAAALPIVTTLGNDVLGNPVYPSSTVAITGAAYFTLGSIFELPVPVGSDPDANSAILANEQVYVEAVDYAAETYTLRRGFANTPVYAYDSGAKLSIISTAGLETQGWVANYQNQRSTVEGYWQLMFAGWQDTVMRQKFQSNYGDDGDELARSKAKIIGGSIGGQPVTGLLPFQMERALMYQAPFKGNPSANIPSTFGGITSYAINKPVYNTTLTYDNLSSVLETHYNNGGGGDQLMVCSPSIKKIVSAWAQTNRETNGATRVERDFGVVVDRIITDFGTLDIAMSRSMNKHEFFVIDPSKIGFIEGIPWTEAELPNSETPLLTRWFTYGVFGAVLTCPTHHTWGRIDVSTLRNTGLTNLCVEPTPTVTSWPGTVV